jgi:hypothetical protein
MDGIIAEKIRQLTVDYDASTPTQKLMLRITAKHWTRPKPRAASAASALSMPAVIAACLSMLGLGL